MELLKRSQDWKLITSLLTMSTRCDCLARIVNYVHLRAATVHCKPILSIFVVLLVEMRTSCVCHSLKNFRGGRTLILPAKKSWQNWKRLVIFKPFSTESRRWSGIHWFWFVCGLENVRSLNLQPNRIKLKLAATQLRAFFPLFIFLLRVLVFAEEPTSSFVLISWLW